MSAYCAIPSCPHRVNGSLILCEEHWWMVPATTRAMVRLAAAEMTAQGGTPTDRWSDATTLALEAAVKKERKET